MALALLDFQSADRNFVRLTIDTGTNLFYRYKVGQSIASREGIDWVDDITYTSPIIPRSGNSPDLLSSGATIQVPVRYFNRDACYIQLLTFRNAQGLAPAFSRVLQIPVGIQAGAPPPFSQQPFQQPSQQPFQQPAPFSRPKSISPMSQSIFNPTRRIPNIHPSSLARTTSVESLLGRIVALAMPITLGDLPVPIQRRGDYQAYGSPDLAPGSLFNTLHRLLYRLQALPTGSYNTRRNGPEMMLSNRLGRSFLRSQDEAPDDDWVLLLPCLINAANHWRMRVRPEENIAAADLPAAPASPLGPSGASATVPSGASPTVPSGASPAGPTGSAAAISEIAKSLTDGADAAGTTASGKVLLSFEPVPQTTWNGDPRSVYNHQTPMTIQLRIAIAGEIPAQPLPKAIFTFTVKDAKKQDLHFEKIERRKDISPGSVQSFTFTAEEIRRLPMHRPLSLFAEIRWLASDGQHELNAVGSTEFLLTGAWSIKQQGQAVSDEFELTDMTQYRAFWNKIWESPVLDTAGMQDSSSKKYGWEISVNGKYFMMLTAAHDANGLMATKLLTGPQDADAVKDSTEGRMKAGIELSIKELNKLLPAMHDHPPPLDDDKLEAILHERFAHDHSTEFIYHFRLKGKAGERGMIWVIPIFKLFEFTLNKIETTDEHGVVTKVTEEKVRFPLPVASRSIGLKSE